MRVSHVWLLICTFLAVPVTADSLKASYSNLVDPDIQSLRKWTCILAIPIILFSALGFVSSSISVCCSTHFCGPRASPVSGI